MQLSRVWGNQYECKHKYNNKYVCMCVCVDANTTAITTGLRACVCENKTKLYTILKKKKKAHN